MKTIESLINASKKVYVRMSSDEVCRRFFAQAEREGFCSEEKNRPKKSPRISSLCYLTKRSAMSAPLAGSRQGREQRMWSWLKLRSYLHRNTPCCALCAVFAERQERNPSKRFCSNLGVSRGRLCRVKFCTALIKEYGVKKSANIYSKIY